MGRMDQTNEYFTQNYGIYSAIDKKEKQKLLDLVLRTSN